jgi:streptogramin lyase
MRSSYPIVAVLSLLAACGDEDGRSDGEGGLDGVPLTASATAGDETASGSQGSASGSADGPGSGEASMTAADGNDGNDGNDGGEPKFDVGSPDGGPACGGGMGGDGTLSYIWIANSSQGTVSKIDTESMIEEGRYIVRPDSAGSPSRTSVSLSGDVGVANRIGGVTKIYGNVADCQESNGIPAIQTSSGGADVLAWGQEECVAWYTPLAYSSNRPMAWAQGVMNTATCRYEDEKLWTAGANGAGTTQVLLLDGETGVVEQTVNIPEVQSSIGIYGGAVDGDGNFWGSETGGTRLIRVDRQNFTYQTWAGPGGYGIAVDSVGRPWFCAGGGASRFDPVLQTWQTLPSPGGNAWGGCMTDGDSTLWHCRQMDSMLVGIDTETLTVTQQIQLPAYAHGISIDFHGNVWAVGFVSNQAFRVDPVTGTIDTFSDLVGAYTYSDMTGFALSTAGTPSG